MKTTTTFLPLLLFINFCFSQSYKTQFDQLLQQGDSLQQIQLLKKWATEDPENPELMTSYFNHYFFQSQEEFIGVTLKRPNSHAIEFQDSTGQTGYFGSQIIYKEDLLQKAFSKIDEGIEKFPNRLDMRFGKIYALGQTEDWENYTDEILKSIRHGEKINYKWTWTYNENFKDDQEFFLSTLQDYQVRMFSLGEDELLVNIRKIAEEILKYNPEHIQSLSNLAITHLFKQEYNKGIQVLLEAEKIDPSDDVILGNLAHAYKLNGDPDHALIYYEKMLKLENPDAVEFAKEQIKALKK